MYNSDVSCMEYTERFKVKLNILLGSNFAGFFCSGFLELWISSFNTKRSKTGKPVLPVWSDLLHIFGQKENLIGIKLCKIFLPQKFYATHTVKENCFYENSSKKRILVWPELLKKSLMVSESTPSYCWYIRAVVSSPVVAELSQVETGLFSHMHSVIRELLGKSLCAAGRVAPGVRRDRWTLHTWVLGSVQAWAAWDPAGRGGICCLGNGDFPGELLSVLDESLNRKGLDEPLPSGL